MKDIINNLKPKNTTGYGGINKKIVIKPAAYIADILSEIINSSSKTGIVQDNFKIVKMMPIFKNGNKCPFYLSVQKF